MISAPLAEALQLRRSDFNSRFKLTAQRYPQLDGGELLRFIAESVDPLICAVHRHDSQAVADVVNVAYDCALQLVGQRLTLDVGRYRVIPETWREVLTAAAAVLSDRPARLIPAFTNAVHQLASSESADAVTWKQRMRRLAAQATSEEELLRAGEVVAWQCGLAHYREAALAALNVLPEPLACLALELEAQQWEPTRRRLQSDRWFDHAQPHSTAMRIVRHAGGFRGLGGSFLQPPLVKSVSGGWLVQSAADRWLLIADAFGATLHRATAEEWNAADPGSAIEHVGTRLMHAGKSLDIPGAGPITSCALSEHAIACTFAHSHHIALVALSS